MIRISLAEYACRFFQTFNRCRFCQFFEGIFESLLTPEDAVISDELNHASIIDGIRLCKAKKYRYKHRDMQGKVQIILSAHFLR